MAQFHDEAVLPSHEKERVRELYRYYPSSLDPSDEDKDIHDHDEEATFAGPRLSPDSVLTALAQLSALRIDCERAFVSLIDSEEQHIIAEATRSISLTDSKCHAQDDGLAFGAMTLDLLSGVCGGTFQVLTGRESCSGVHTENIRADQTRYVINDFCKELMYKERPYVAGSPFMRFYACVPITAASGLVIGSLSLVDNKPRDGLSKEHYLILVEIAASIMSHLSLLKISREHDRAGRLLQGLKYFSQRDSLTTATKATDGKPEPLNREALPRDSRTQDEEAGLEYGATPRSERSGSTAFFSDTTATATSEGLGTIFSNRVSDRSSSIVTSTPTRADYQPPAAVESLPSLPKAATSRTGDINNMRQALSFDSTPRNVLGAYKNAAAILSQAMDLDGVVFLDASPADVANDSDKPGQSEFLEQPSEIQGPDTSQYGLTPKDKPMHPRGELCTKLGEAIRSRPNKESSTRKKNLFLLPERIQRKLQGIYPRGAVLVLDRDSHEEPMSEDLIEVEDALRFCSPNATSIMYMPLWNPNKLNWAVGSFGWTTSPKRAFSPEDFAYFTAFGSLIMVEVMRLELAATDQMKSDFISSVSHELRSPLHGILGSAELLMEESMPNGQREILTMITKCGKSLLDTMEHILVYSKINAHTKDRRKRLNSKLSGPDQTSSDEIYESHAIFDLASLVEDTVESSAVGRDFSNHWLNDDTMLRGQPGIPITGSDSTLHHAPPSVLLAIESMSSWLVKSEAGAWRRILMNLLGNAMKYTSTGFVEVELCSAEPSISTPPERTQATITLRVRDSGRGISKRYLRNHLYTPFSQENVLSSGAGLGLSIVRQLVSSLNGKINVQSEVGWGTCFVVSVPVTLEPRSAHDTTAVVLKSLTEGRTLCLLALDLYPELDDEPTGILSPSLRTSIAQKKALTNYAQQWFGMKVISSQTANDVEADVIIVEEDKLHILQSLDRSLSHVTVGTKPTPLIVLCNEATLTHHTIDLSSRIQYLTRPIGPRKLANALSACLDVSEADRPPTRSPTDLAQRTASRNPALSHSSISDDPALRDIPLDSDVSKLTQSSMSKKTGQQLTSARLLLVDDNAINLKILVACVKKLGCFYSTAGNGLEALKLYQNSPQHFDLILMDISMPVMDGYASTRAIRAFEAKSNLQRSTIIALTGLGSTEAQRNGQSSGMDQFLTKPLSMQRIKEIIEENMKAWDAC